MQSLGVKLLVVDSNVQLFSFPDPWLPISTTRIAIPQLFSPLISTHFVPSSGTFMVQKPMGTNPLTDHLFSLETLRIFTHSADITRFEKLREMSNWPSFYEYLQVCNANKPGVMIDCRCAKCFRTMLMVNVLGIEDKITTFHIPFQKKSMLRRIVKTRYKYLYFKEMASHARRSNKLKLLPFIYFPMLIYKLTKWIDPLLGYKFK